MMDDCYFSPLISKRKQLTFKIGKKEIMGTVKQDQWQTTWQWSLHIYRTTWCQVPTFAAAAAKSLQSCPTLCDPVEGSPPGFPIPGILQARTLEWVAISFSNAWKWKVKVKSLSHVRLLATPWTAAYQAPPWDPPGNSTGVRCHCLLLNKYFRLCGPYYCI